MRKGMKRFLSIMLALVMVVAMTATAKTEVRADTTYTITINNATSGHTYEAYQIFAGTLSGTGTTNDPYVLSSITWGSGIDSNKTSNLLTELQALTVNGSEPFKDCSTPRDVADALTSDNVEAFADVVVKYLSSTATGESGSLYTISGLYAGYYLVKDKDNSIASTADDAYTDYILKVVEDINITPKSDTPSLTKKVQETNDTTGSTTDWQNGADYDIGDEVPFKLTAVLPDDSSAFADYTTYAITFHDTLSAGLTFTQSSVKVYVVSGSDKTEVGSNCYTVDYPEPAALGTDTSSFTVKISNVKSLTNTSEDSITVSAGDSIVVEYTAALNTYAVIGSEGNPNTAYLTYSNNPNSSSSYGTTPVDKVIVYTFTLNVNKVKTAASGSGTEALSGAGFTLYKYSSSSNGYKAVGSEVTGVTTFTFKGLDSGQYKIVETTVPSGYNKADDIEFVIVAEYNTDSDNPGFTSLEIKDLSGNVISSGTNKTFTVEANNTATNISTDVLNVVGSNLPETGGIGTTLFYIIGAILVAGAGVLLVTRRRMKRA